jgi:uncharacterized membrane protein
VRHASVCFISCRIRIFWYALFWVVVGVGLAITIVGLPVSIVIFVGISRWILDPIVRGGFAMLERKPMDIPQ